MNRIEKVTLLILCLVLMGTFITMELNQQNKDFLFAMGCIGVCFTLLTGTIFNYLNK